MPDENPDRSPNLDALLKWVIWIGAIFLVIVLSAWVKFGEFPSAIYAEVKFDEVRWGPHRTIAEVDQALSWFERREISRDSIRPGLLRGSVEPLLENIEVQFVSYYVGNFGFIVVYDLNGTKLTQLKSDV